MHETIIHGLGDLAGIHKHQKGLKFKPLLDRLQTLSFNHKTSSLLTSML